MDKKSKKSAKIHKCPVEKAAKVISKKWMLLVIRDLLLGKKRFGEFMESINGINPRMLSARLSELQEKGIIKKKVYREIPLHAEYELTPKGMDLAAILDQMKKWGESL